MPQEIYCDESGFTGNKLLDRTQPFFTYASVAVRNEDAKYFVEKIIKDYQIQGNELKAQRLLKFNRGRRAITETLKHFSDAFLVSVLHKKYSLACKFFDILYLIEKTQVQLPPDMQKTLVFLNRLSIPTRYPDDLQRMIKDYTQEKSGEIFEQSKEVLRWLKKLY